MSEKSPLGLNVDKLIPYNVMIVEDSAIDQLLMKQFLKAEMFNVIHTANNGNAALDYLANENGSVDIVVIDYVMPGKNGLETVAEIKNLYPRIIILMATAKADKSFVRELQKIKVHGVLVKPINKKLIVEKFAEALGRRDLLPKYVIKTPESSAKIDLNNLKIPPIPSVMVQVIEFDDSSVEGSQELEKIINPDKSLSLDILKISNSSFYGRSGSVKSLKDAITLLGTKTIKNLVILQSQKKHATTLTEEIVKKHISRLPILSALVCSDLTKPLNLKNLRADIFTYSLFRRIGSTILALNFKDRYEEVLRTLEQGQQNLSDIELSEFGTDSREVGLKVFSFWKMPSPYLSIVNQQNFLPSQMKEVSDYDKLARLGEIIAKKLLEIKLSPDEEILFDLLFVVFKAEDKVRTAFGSDYYENIKEHPYFF